MIDERLAILNGLDLYRSVQRMLVIDRDDGSCVICWFKHGRMRKANEVHHVYGRGKKAGDWREQYTRLMCVCKECHMQAPPAQDRHSKQAWVIELLDKANKEPINPNFEHQYEYDDYD